MDFRKVTPDTINYTDFLCFSNFSNKLCLKASQKFLRDTYIFQKLLSYYCTTKPAFFKHFLATTEYCRRFIWMPIATPLPLSDCRPSQVWELLISKSPYTIHRRKRKALFFTSAPDTTQNQRLNVDVSLLLHTYQSRPIPVEVADASQVFF
jgi:hypothetical protein